MNKKIIISISVIVLVLVGTAVYIFTAKKALAPVSSTPGVTLTASQQVIEGLLTADEKKANPRITIVKEKDGYINANIFFNPGGNYILAARVNGTWVKVAEGNGIPKCSDTAKYDFPKDIAACYDY